MLGNNCFFLETTPGKNAQLFSNFTSNATSATFAFSPNTRISELLFKIDLSDFGYLTIDTFNMEAHKDAVLKNRSVTGNYENFSLSPGLNQITCDGNISDITISNYSRWL